METWALTLGTLPMMILPWIFQVMAIVTALVIWERFFRVRR
jgi:hypothetical protein